MRIPILIFTIFLFPAFCSAATIYVPDNFPKIQDAINNAVNGDTIIVRPGTYVENIDFKGKAITLTSEMGPDVTVIDGSNPANPDFGSVVLIANNEGLDSVIDGFSLINGSGTFVSSNNCYAGGGIMCNDSSPTITNNLINNNICNFGAGIVCAFGASPKIKENLITNNSASNNTTSGVGAGGGIGCVYSASPEILNNIITKNSATNYWDAGGGGINCSYDCSPLIMNNLISENFTTNGQPKSTGGCGCGIICVSNSNAIIKYNLITQNKGDNTGGVEAYDNCSLTIENNIICNNHVTYRCGGISSCLSSFASIKNNLIFGNRADHGGAIFSSKDSSINALNNTVFGNSAACDGGAINCIEGCTLEISNTIFWNNEAPVGPEIWIGTMYNPSTVTISYSDVKGGKNSVYVDPGSTLNWGAGMIDADPLFVDPANDDFHLTWISPCINRGINDSAPSVDFEGDPRPFMGTVDMGADEFIGVHPLEANLFALSEATGGIVNLSVNGGMNNAGRNYLLLGSVTGTAPGTPLPGGFTTLSLNWDIFTSMVIGLNNTPVFSNFMGPLDSAGTAVAQFDTLGPIPGTAGLTLRFGGSVNLNPHFHALVLDGVYAAAPGQDAPLFHPLGDLEDHEVHELTWKIRDKVLRLLMKKGHLPEDAAPEADLLPFGSPVLSGCYAAAVKGTVCLGNKRGTYLQREGRMPGARFMEFSGDCCAEADGFTLHANVRVHGRKRKQLERLCRYMARPAIATKRLERLADGRVRYRLRHVFHDGTRAILFDPLTFIEKLCALVPPPRANLVTYHGVLAPNAAWRARVAPPADSTGALYSRKHHQKMPLEETSAPEKARRYTWAQLLKRVFEIDALQCPYCQGRRKLIAFITEAPVIRAILECLDLPGDPPVLWPSRWPP